MNGSIRERIIKKGKDKKGKMKENLKVYDVYYRYLDPQSGKWKQTSKKGFRTKSAAEDYILKINTQMGENKFVQPDKITLREYLLDWIKSYVEVNLRPTTIAGYKLNIEKHIIPYLGSVQLQDLSVSHIDDFYAQIQKNGRVDGKGGLSAKSIIYIHRVLNEALEHAVKKHIIPYNVAKDAVKPKLKKYKGQVYNEEEIKELLFVAKDTSMEVPIALAALCGLRRGEVLGLMYSEISFENDTIRICRQLIPTKNGPQFEEPKSEDSNRIINAPHEVIKIIKKHQEFQEENKKLLGAEYKDNDLVNCNEDGSMIDPRVLSKRFSEFLKKNHLKHIRFHDLRHSCATLMLNSGVQMKVASQILGHSSIGITADLYTHVITDMKKDAADKISKEIFNTNSNDK